MKKQTSSRNSEANPCQFVDMKDVLEPCAKGSAKLERFTMTEGMSLLTARKAQQSGWEGDFCPPGDYVSNHPTLYHYTIGDRAKSILQDGMIKTTSAFIEKRERPATWLSSNRDWEETANKTVGRSDGTMVFGDKDLTRKYGGGLYRFRVRQEGIEVHDWASWKRHSRVSEQIATGLERAAVRSGADPSEHFTVFGPIGSEHWEAIEYWTGSKWQELDREDIVEIFGSTFEQNEYVA